MSNEKVLVIRKPDRTIHQVPIGNKARLVSFNNRLPAAQKWSFETMSAEEAAKLPFIDKDYVTAGEAVTKLKDLESGVIAKDQRIAELEALLAGKNAAKPEETAVEKIVRIKAAGTEAEVISILGEDIRKTVKDAADAQIASFTAQ